jgi:hypothetical protein
LAILYSNRLSNLAELTFQSVSFNLLSQKNK